MNGMDILIHTPIWAYAIFAYILMVGFKATKDRVVTFKSLFIAPGIFTILTIHTLMDRTAHNFKYLILWIIVFLLSMFIGKLQIKSLKIKVDRENRLLKVSGSFITLILLLLIFLSKYYYGVVSVVNPTLAHSPIIIIYILVVSGISTGMMWGRLIEYLRVYSEDN